MKTKKFNVKHSILVGALLVYPKLVHAGGEKGDAAHAVYCTALENTKFTESRYYLLDYVDEQGGKVELMMDRPESVNENFKLISSKLKEHLPALYLRYFYSIELYESKNETKNNFEEYVTQDWKSTNMPLEITKVSEQSRLPKNCDINNVQQIVTYAKSDDYFYNLPLVNEIKSRNNKIEYSMLLFHEFLRKSSLSTENIIKLNRYLHSENYYYNDTDMDRITSRLYNLGIYTKRDNVKFEHLIKKLMEEMPSWSLFGIDVDDYLNPIINKLVREDRKKLDLLNDQLDTISHIKTDYRCNAISDLKQKFAIQLNEYINPNGNYDSAYLKYKYNLVGKAFGRYFITKVGKKEISSIGLSISMGSFDGDYITDIVLELHRSVASLVKEIETKANMYCGTQQ